MGSKYDTTTRVVRIAIGHPADAGVTLRSGDDTRFVKVWADGAVKLLVNTPKGTLTRTANRKDGFELLIGVQPSLKHGEIVRVYRVAPDWTLETLAFPDWPRNLQSDAVKSARPATQPAASQNGPVEIVRGRMYRRGKDLIKATKDRGDYWSGISQHNGGQVEFKASQVSAA